MKVGATGLMTLLLSLVFATFMAGVSFAGPIDTDGDGLTDDVDNCPRNFNPDQMDSDSDTRGDECDNCLDDPNALQIDSNNDGCGNQCDADITNDGLIGGPDFSAFGPTFGSSVPPTSPDFDFRGPASAVPEFGNPPDGLIGGPDFTTLALAFGGTPGPGLPPDTDCDGDGAP